MTGFGRSELQVKGVKLGIEIKTVNHRFLDINCKLPQAYSAFEPEVTKVVKKHLGRGRVDIYITRTQVKEPNYKVVLNLDLFSSYLGVAGEVLSAVDDETAADRQQQFALRLLERREILDVVSDETFSTSEKTLLEKAIQKALLEVVAMRKREGGILEKALKKEVTSIQKGVTFLEAYAKKMPSIFKKRLETRFSKLDLELPVDEQRLAQEVALLIDRADVTEEIVRLKSHLEQFLESIKKPECGRKLEFLLQEMGREVNTIGSKSQDKDVTNIVVEAKASLEKLREQALNIE